MKFERTDALPPTPILALDVPDASTASELVQSIGAPLRFVKVGLQLFIATGPDLVRDLKGQGLGVFLDLKLHDIPRTVTRAVESSMALGVDMLTVHAAGGPEMLRAASDAASDAVRLLAVTVLTSHAAQEPVDRGGRDPLRLEDEVGRLARVSADADIRGAVCSVAEVAVCREVLGAAATIVTPGIRFPGDAPGDQRRTATPAEAARAGADYLVVGRSVTGAADPGVAFRRVLDDIAVVSGVDSGR